MGLAGHSKRSPLDCSVLRLDGLEAVLTGFVSHPFCGRVTAFCPGPVSNVEEAGERFTFLDSQESCRPKLELSGLARRVGKGSKLTQWIPGQGPFCAVFAGQICGASKAV